LRRGALTAPPGSVTRLRSPRPRRLAASPPPVAGRQDSTATLVVVAATAAVAALAGEELAPNLAGGEVGGVHVGVRRAVANRAQDRGEVARRDALRGDCLHIRGHNRPGDGARC